MEKLLKEEKYEAAQFILDQLKIDYLSGCYQCGMCTNSCPVSNINPEFNPRLIMHKLALGLIEELALSKEIWLCSHCYVCQERCPQQVAISDLFSALQNMAVIELGRVNPGLIKVVQYMQNYGGLYELDDFVNDDREAIGLPLKEQSNDLKVIINSGPLKNLKT